VRAVGVPPPPQAAPPPGGDPSSAGGAPPGADLQDGHSPNRRTLLIVVGGLLVALVIAAVVFIVAKPKEKTVPAVVGQELSSAQVILDDDNFDAKVKRVTNVAADGRVLAQDPQAGQKADDGSSVTLTVSSGPGQGTVPDVADLAEPKATAALEASGFKVTSKQENSSAVESGKVIRTDPPAGTQAEKDSSVTLIVSKGPASVGVPDVVGATEASAKNTIQGAGLLVEVTQERSNQSPGDVLSQSPASGTVVTLGSSVKIIVDKAPVPVDIPNVQGQPVEDATSTLSDLGLAVFFRNKTVTNQAQVGTVLRQQPVPGSKAEPGTNVILQVGKAGNTPTPPPTNPTTPTTQTATTSANPTTPSTPTTPTTTSP
jgi:beta-lactam-binding protein with PASTA domain